MPSKTRWALNPRKWFGTISTAHHKHETKQNHLITHEPTITTRVIQLPTNVPRLPTARTKTKRRSIPVSNETFSTPITQLQLPAFSIRRERTSTLLPSSTTVNRQNAFFPVHTEPTIRKNVRLENKLSIDTTRCNTQPILTTVYNTSKQENIQKDFQTKIIQMSISNMSHCCLIDYPRETSNLIDASTLPTRSSASSLVEDSDNSSSSGIFTDERQITESKETLTTVEVLSVESIQDSQTSMNHFNPRPVIHHYRRPVTVFDINDDIPQQQQTSIMRSSRSQSAEGILNDDQTDSTSKSRQSSAAIMKKIEKRMPTNRLPTNKLGKAGFVRITNDTYRLTNSQMNYLTRQRQNSINSFFPYLNNEDSLRSAHNEECYATLPRTSSTEQLNNNIQNDLRIIVDECIRPMVTSINKNRLTKNYQHRYKRTQINNDHTQIDIDNITDKLLSSINYSTYAPYQRCN